MSIYLDASGELIVSDRDMHSALESFVGLTDSGIQRNWEHLLEEILLLAVVAVLSEAENWNDNEDYD